jgi:hypothetical protein
MVRLDRPHLKVRDAEDRKSKGGDGMSTVVPIAIVIVFVALLFSSVRITREYE